MLLDNTIKLGGNLRKIKIQIQCFDANLITAHLILVIRDDLLICFCIKKHTGYICSLSGLVLHIGENLVAA